jgi:hypothetical protein
MVVFKYGKTSMFFFSECGKLKSILNSTQEKKCCIEDAKFCHKKKLLAAPM